VRCGALLLRCGALGGVWSDCEVWGRGSAAVSLFDEKARKKRGRSRGEDEKRGGLREEPSNRPRQRRREIWRDLQL
jgi:hypothetical protein